jgi:predicted DNA-binding protein (MmcQ/YjbR family)
MARNCSTLPSVSLPPAHHFLTLGKQSTRSQEIMPGAKIGARTESLKAVLAAKPGAVAVPVAAPRSTQPVALMYKVMGKMFAILSVRGEEFVILKCDPHLVNMLREKYEGVGHRSHLDQRFWISVNLDADVPKAEITRLVSQSYALVCASLTRKQKEELAALEK